MPSTYTCRACTRALLTASSRPAARSQAQRHFASKPTPKAFPGAVPTSKPTTAAPTPTKSAGKAPVKPAAFPGTVTGSIASKLRQKAPLFTEPYVAYGACSQLIKECVRPGEYTIPQALEKRGEIPTDENGTHIGVGEGWWYESLGLTPTFLNWSQITFIHMWLLQVRFRMLPTTHAPIWIEHMTNHAFYAAEDRLAVWHKYTATSLRQKAMKDMFSQWRAVLLSYDEGLMKGDAMLAAAVWRNLLGAKKDVDFEKLASIVGYMRKELRRLELASDEQVVDGSWKFEGDPGDMGEVVRRTSTAMLATMKK